MNYNTQKLIKDHKRNNIDIPNLITIVKPKYEVYSIEEFYE